MMNNYNIPITLFLLHNIHIINDSGAKKNPHGCFTFYIFRLINTFDLVEDGQNYVGVYMIHEVIGLKELKSAKINETTALIRVDMLPLSLVMSK